MDQQIFGDFHVRGRLKGIGKTAQDILGLLRYDGGKNILTTINSNTETIQKLTKCIHTDVDHKMDELYYAVRSITSGSSNTTENSYKVIPITIAVDGNQNSTPDFEDNPDPDATTDYDQYFTNKYVVKVNYHGIEVIGDAYTTKDDGTKLLITTPYIPNCLLIDGKLYDKSYKMLTPTYTPIEEDVPEAITKSMPTKIEVMKTGNNEIPYVIVTENGIDTKYQYDTVVREFIVTVNGEESVEYEYYCKMSIDDNKLVIKAGPSEEESNELFTCDLSNYYNVSENTDFAIYHRIDKITVFESNETITQVDLLLMDDTKEKYMPGSYGVSAIHFDDDKNREYIIIQDANGDPIAKHSLANFAPTKVTEYVLRPDPDYTLTVTQTDNIITKVTYKNEDTNEFVTYEIDSESGKLIISGTMYASDNNTYDSGSITYKNEYITIATDERKFSEFNLVQYEMCSIVTTYERITTTEVPKTANTKYKFNFQCPSGCTSIHMLPTFFQPKPTVFPNIGNTLRQSPAINDVSYVSLSSSEDPDDTDEPRECTYLYTYNKSTKAPPRLLPWDNKYENMTVNITLSSATLVYDSETYYPLFMCDLGENQDDTIYLIKHGTPHLKTYEKQEKPTIDDTQGGGQEHEELLKANE